MRTIVLTFIILLLSTVVHVTDSCSSWFRRESPKPEIVEQTIINERTITEQSIINETATTTEQPIEVATLKTTASECPVCSCNNTSATTTTTNIAPPLLPPVVTRDMNSDSNLFKINGIPCPKEEKYKYFCGGKGRCFMIMFSEIDFVIGCECRFPYMGLRCEEKRSELKLKTEPEYYKSPNNTDVPKEEGFKVERKPIDDEEEGFIFINKADGKEVNGWIDQVELNNVKLDYKVQNKFDEENLILQNDNNQKDRRNAGINKMRRGEK